MANYDLTTYCTGPQANACDAATALEVKLETIDDSKNIRFIEVLTEGHNYYGVVIYDT